MGLDISFYKKSRQEIGYFRKVNLLVSFFENRGYKVENLQPIEITQEDILVLQDYCHKVLKNPELAPELLPTLEGFFFGSTKYDEHYLEQVENVLEYIEERLLPIFEELDPDEFIEFEIWY